MASQIPCVKNDAGGYTFYVSLVSQANTKIFQANPTLASGDAQIAIDDGAPANLGTLPAVDADFTKRVKVVLSQAETNGDNLTIIFSDAAGAEWCDLTINIQTAGQTLDTIDTNIDDIETDTGTTLDGKIDTIDGIVDSILVDTAVIGALGAGLTAITDKTDLIPASPAAVGDIPTAGAIADQVWEEAIADHSGTAGSTAEQLAAAGAAGDPWSTALPGAYAAGTAGEALGKAFKILKNKWEIIGNQLIIYDNDGSTALYTFDLANSAGTASSIRVYKRTPA